MLAPVILLNAVRRLFGSQQKKTSHHWGNAQTHTHQTHHQHQESSTSSTRQRTAKRGKKLFEKGEGEYVDFEEVKE